MTRRIHSCWLDSFPHTRVCEIFIHSINKQKKRIFYFPFFPDCIADVWLLLITTKSWSMLFLLSLSFGYDSLQLSLEWTHHSLGCFQLLYFSTRPKIWGGRSSACRGNTFEFINSLLPCLSFIYIYYSLFIFFCLFSYQFFLFLFYLIMIYFWTESNLLPILKWHPCWNGRARFVFPSKAWVLARPFLALWFLEHFSTNPMHTTLPPMHIYIYTQKTSQAAHWISRWRMLMMSYFCVVADDQIRYPIEPVSASAAGRDQGRSMVGRHRTESRTWT